MAKAKVCRARDLRIPGVVVVCLSWLGLDSLLFSIWAFIGWKLAKLAKNIFPWIHRFQFSRLKGGRSKAHQSQQNSASCFAAMVKPRSTLMIAFKACSCWVFS
jgi:hypothetical protein